MSTTGHVDVTPRRWGLGHTALVLGVVSLFLSMFAWDWFAWGGVVLGVPVAIAALLTGLRARREGARTLGTVAAVLAVAVLLIPVVWTIVALIAD